MATTPARCKPLVLVIEDDDDVREIVAVVLAERGYALLEARTGREGLQVARHAVLPPQLILLDIMMPDMDGLAFLQEAKRDPALAAIPVVVISAMRRRSDLLPAGVDAWLRKPFELDVLLATVGRFCVAADGSDTLPLALAGRAPHFMERRQQDVRDLQEAFVDSNYEEIGTIAKNLKEIGPSFGFASLSTLGARLEHAADRADRSAVAAALVELVGFLQTASPDHLGVPV